MPGYSFPSPSSLLPSSGPKWSHIHFVIWCHGMSYERLSKGPRFLPFFRPLPVSLLFQLHCRGGYFIHVTWRSHNGTKIKWKKKNLFRFQGQLYVLVFFLKPLQAFQIPHLVKTYYCSDTDWIALLNLNHFLVSWDLIKKTITAFIIKILWRSGYTCDNWDASLICNHNVWSTVSNIQTT